MFVIERGFVGIVCVWIFVCEVIVATFVKRYSYGILAYYSVFVKIFSEVFKSVGVIVCVMLNDDDMIDCVVVDIVW